MHPALSTLIALTGLASTAVASPPPSEVFTPPQSCGTTATVVYFEPGSAALTEEAEQALAGFAATLEGCAIEAIETRTTSLADEAANEPIALGQTRDTSVQAALSRHGLVTARGVDRRAQPAAAAPEAAHESPLARRVDIRVFAVPAGHIG